MIIAIFLLFQFIMPDLAANSTFQSVQQMQSLQLDSTDEDGIGPFGLLQGEDKETLVIWRKNSTATIDNKTVWAASLGNWKAVGGSGGGDITGEEGEWEPQLFFDGVEATYQSRSGEFYKLGKLVHVYASIVFDDSVVGVSDIEVKGYPFPTKHNQVPFSALWSENQVMINGTYIIGESIIASSLLSLSTEQLLSLNTEQLLSLSTV